MSAAQMAVLTNEALTSAMAASASCFHCGLPTADQSKHHIIFAGKRQAMCCVGCAAVANTIINAGLGHYYETRTAPALSQNQSPLRPEIVDKVSAKDFIKVTTTAGSFALPEIESQYLFNVVTNSHAVTSDTKSATFYIDGITCSACVWLAEATLRRLPGVKLADINYITHRATVTWQAGHANIAGMVDAVQGVGLQASPIAAVENQLARTNAKRLLLKQLGVALLAMMQVMMFTVPQYWSAPEDISREARQLMNWASCLLSLPVVLYAAQPFWIGARRDWRTRHISMDSPVALAIAATFATSIWSLWLVPEKWHGALYFDSLGMFVFLLLAARYLELSIRDRALCRIERLANAAPVIAHRLTQYPATRQATEVAVATLARGDVILIATGQLIATDSVIVEGVGEVDEAIVTGESRPVIRNPGETLIGGTMNLGSPLIARVERVGGATMLASIARMAERALGERPQLAILTDRVARIVAPALVVLAVLAGIAWLFIDASQSFNVLVAVLAITCPCAVALAAPTAFAIANLQAGEGGLLIARGHVLETLPQLTDVVFDKTGTLTTGAMAISNIETRQGVTHEAALEIAAALEWGAAHPVAKSIRNIVGNSRALTATGLCSIPGCGVEGVIDGAKYRFGHGAFACTEIDADSEARSDAFVLSCNGKWLATFHADDPLKPDAAATVQALQQAGLRVHLLSGDRSASVMRVAHALGINRLQVGSEQSPAQKLAYIEQLHREGCKVAMIGDGINDAPVLGAADVAIAMAAGADLPRLTADAVLLAPNLLVIPTTLALARSARRIIRQNFAWAIAYNLFAIPLALANVVNPAWAALGMGASGLIVVLNSMRLLVSPRKVG